MAHVVMYVLRLTAIPSMETYLSDSALKSISIQKSDQQRLRSTRSTSYTSVFLSHSHHDRELVEGLVAKLARQGISVYVDWKDASLPSSPTRTTVETIKEQIATNDVFMLLASDRALESKWVPWELGVADKSKGYERIVVVPVTRNGSFRGSEYINVYRQIKEVGSGLQIFGAGGSGAGQAAGPFLSRKARIYG
ncbi:MAG: hypothetical protein CMM84_19165 [Rhodothermaceae bacterium]|nr:hypothetical protein [Rhodothermaceae bacterium]MBC13127.1 hypothetical protein [Rhodothermaceae bacterium]